MKISIVMKRYFIGALAVLLASCSNPGQKPQLLRSVCVTTPSPREETTVKTYSGIVQEAHEIRVGFKTPGQIEKLYVKEGDHVRKGQLLAALDDKDYKLGVEALQIQYDNVSAEVARARKLFENRSMAANDFEKALAGLEQLGVQLQTNKNKLDYTRLYAPVDGVIRSSDFAVSEMVDAGTAVFSLLDLSGMEVNVDVPVKDYSQRDNFVGFYCTRTGSEGEKFPMRLVSIVPKADGNQLYRMKLAFDGKPQGLTSGVNVEVGVECSLSEGNGEFLLPVSCLFSDGKSSFVWTLDAEVKVSRRELSLGGLNADGRAIVTEGLDGNERVVRAGVNSLKEGLTVKVLENPSETNEGGIL